jgi:hypothetical protein
MVKIYLVANSAMTDRAGFCNKLRGKEIREASSAEANRGVVFVTYNYISLSGKTGDVNLRPPLVEQVIAGAGETTGAFNH